MNLQDLKCGCGSKALIYYKGLWMCGLCMVLAQEKFQEYEKKIVTGIMEAEWRK